MSPTSWSAPRVRACGLPRPDGYARMVLRGAHAVSGMALLAHDRAGHGEPLVLLHDGKQGFRFSIRRGWPRRVGGAGFSAAAGAVAVGAQSVGVLPQLVSVGACFGQLVL